MENNHDIDTMFNRASQHEEPAGFPGFEKVWNTVEEKLDRKEEKKKKMIPAWLPYGIAASLLLGYGIFFFGDRKATAGSTESVIARSIKAPQQDKGLPVPEHIRKLDSMVQSNARAQKAVVPMEAIAQQSVRKLYDPVLPAAAHEVHAPQIPFLESPAAAEDKPVTDSVQRQHIEEVIVMGIRKEKASSASAVSVASSSLSSKKKVSGLNTVADTAEAVYPIGPAAFRNETHEPEILAYNNNKPFRNNLTVSASGNGNKLAERAEIRIRGAASGLNISSISGTPGSGKVDLSIGYNKSSGGGNDPVIVIDGMITDIEIFRKLDPKKIAAVTILTAEKAVPVFGSRAANGVIVVETKEISKKEKRKLKKILEVNRPEKQ